MKKFLKRKCGWFCILTGVWLIIAPFALGYSSNEVALLNDLAVGAVILAIGWYLCLGMGVKGADQIY